MSLAAQQVQALAGYGQDFGTKKVFVGNIAGPTLYAAGGQTVYASQLGMGGFDVFDCPMLSVSGTYYARIQPLPIDASPSQPQGSVPSVKIMWFVLSTNAEAGAIDLSAEVMRFTAQGV